MRKKIFSIMLLFTTVANAQSLLIGDVDQDGNLSITDVVLLVNMILNDEQRYIDLHKYVDLGLPSGTLWATCNIGAETPDEYGDYFAWGETKGYSSEKNNFDWSTYKYCNGSYNTLTKYNSNSSYGFNGSTDNLTELELIDDAAYQNWGSNWRMPSQEQFAELVNSENTTTEWTTLNNVYGRMITSKTNGNSIFLPAAGYRSESTLYQEGSNGCYWSRTLYTDYQAWANYLFIYSGNVYSYIYNRCDGQSIRPVRINKN